MKKHLMICTLIISSIIIFSFANERGNEESNLSISNRELNANTIHTWFRSNGSFNRDPSTGNAGFLWSNKPARYVSGLWIGAQIGNDTLTTVANYSYEYVNGYTNNNGDPEGEDNSAYRIYRLDNEFGNNDRQNWPNALLGNSDQGAPIYYDSLYGVIHPAEFGSQTMFYCYTDSYPTVHNASGGSTAPLKADIKQLNFASNTGELNYMAFSQFIVINKSTQIWHNAFFNIWTDDDLGDGGDDLIGCDSALKMGYTYNSTNNDPIYGSSPPAVATVLLKGALKYTGNSSDIVTYCVNLDKITRAGYKDVGMTGFSPYGIPVNYVQTYHIMSGFNLDGSTIVNPNGNATKLYYTGDPESHTGWLNIGAGDKRFLLSSGPVDVLPGDTQVISIAQIIVGGSNNLNSVTVNKAFAVSARNYYNSCYGHVFSGVNENNNFADKFRLNQNYPNPFNPETKISYSIPERSNVQLKIYNASGEEVSILVNKIQDNGSYEAVFNASAFPSGIYFYRLKIGSGSKTFSSTKKMILIK